MAHGVNEILLHRISYVALLCYSHNTVTSNLLHLLFNYKIPKHRTLEDALMMSTKLLNTKFRIMARCMLF